MAGTLAGPADTLIAPGGFLVAERTGNQVRRVLDATPDPATPARRLPGRARPCCAAPRWSSACAASSSVRPRGKKKFVRLTDPALVRLGSEIDTERGVARVTVATDAKGTLGPATVRGGRFVVTQGKGAKPISQLALSRKLSCAKPKKSKARAGDRRLDLRQAAQEPPAVGEHARPSATAPRAATPRAPCAARAG